MSDPALRPRDARSSVIIHAVLASASGPRVVRRIRNLSTAGACVEHNGELSPGDDIFLDMGTLKGLHGQVIWSRAKVAGVSFSRFIDLNEARKPLSTERKPHLRLVR
jgi:hypothetical protein